MTYRSAVIFDLDGTLTLPILDFDLIRKEIGVTGPILEALAAMTADARQQADDILARHEAEAAERAMLRPFARETVNSCRERGHPVAILTRNSRISAGVMLNRFDLQVDLLRTREDGETKPSPEPILAICSELGVDPEGSWMVGDYLIDVQAGRAAGSRTVLIADENAVPDFADQADHLIHGLDDLLALLDGA